MKFISTIQVLLVLALLPGCSHNVQCSDQREPNLVNELKPLLIMDISILGESRKNAVITSLDKKVTDVNSDTIFSLFSDGTIIYSKNELKFGPPYCIIKVTGTQVKAFFDTLEEHQIFEGERWQSYFGPSSDFVQIYINYQGQKFIYSSWHELFEDNPKIVVTDRGVESLNDRDKADVIKSCSEDYKIFLKKWNIIRDSIRNLKETS